MPRTNRYIIIYNAQSGPPYTGGNVPLGKKSCGSDMGTGKGGSPHEVANAMRKSLNAALSSGNPLGAEYIVMGQQGGSPFLAWPLPTTGHIPFRGLTEPGGDVSHNSPTATRMSTAPD